jgi:hypothetical protein
MVAAIRESACFRAPLRRATRLPVGEISLTCRRMVKDRNASRSLAGLKCGISQVGSSRTASASQTSLFSSSGLHVAKREPRDLPNSWIYGEK